MALGRCSECGHEMSTTAKSCPNCGSTLSPKERKVRLVNCGFCRGEGYHYIRYEANPNYRSMGGCYNPIFNPVMKNIRHPCSKNHPGAEKCFAECKDGKVEEVYYE